MIISKKNNVDDFPKVTIIVLNWNGKHDTIECIKSLQKLDYQNYDIVIVDNASTDNSVADIEKIFSGITFIKNDKNLGFTGGFNVGIQFAISQNSDYILCLNNDTILDKHCITELVKNGEIVPDCGGLCPIEYDYCYPNKIVYAGGVVGVLHSKLFGYGEDDNGQYSKVKQTRMLCGPAMMIKKEAFLEIGLFDDVFFYGSEDKDLAIRLIKSNYGLLFVPTAKLWHKRRGATGGTITPLTVFFSIRNNLLFVRKHGKIYEVLSFLPYLLLFQIPILLYRVDDKMAGIRSLIFAITWHIYPKLIPQNDMLVKSIKNR